MSSGPDPQSESIRLMRQRFAATRLPFPPALQRVLETEWLFLATCGTWFSGSQRLSIAAAARATDDARRLDTPDASPNESADAADELSPAALDAAAMIALAPATMTNSDIERWESAGLNRFELIEIVGIVSRLHAVDTLLLLNGTPVADLPPPVAGTPRRKAPRKAKQRASRLPTTAPGAIGALSGVPAESEARDRLHRALFGADRLAALPGLTRLQMEFLATKTSIVNQCVY